MTPSRLISALVICALAGIALSLAAAWLCTPRGWPLPNPILISVTVAGRPSKTSSFDEAFLKAFGSQKVMNWYWTSRGTGWSIDAAKADAPRLFRLRTGCPFLATQGYLWIEYAGVSPPQTALSSRSVLAGAMPRSSPVLRGVPYGILPLPFLANSAIYATILFAGWGAYVIRLSRRRKKANSCHACGYDLAGLPGPCPECGI